MVAKTKGSIGYVEMTYALQNKIKFGEVINSENEPIRASLESIVTAGDNAPQRNPRRLAIFDHECALGKVRTRLRAPCGQWFYTKLPKDKGPAVVDFLRWVIP